MEDGLGPFVDAVLKGIPTSVLILVVMEYGRG